ncbi:MAG TPA: hypothetical protein PLW96_07065 [Bacteroidales bacterium]|nr:hypothetical protein [Bacteroidales bacterium]
MKSEEEDLLEYDDEKALSFIRNQLPQEMKSKHSDDDYYYLLDSIYEYYENKGFLNDDEEEVTVDLDELSDFVYQAAKEGKLSFSREEVGFFVDAEIAYCESLGIFEAED